MITKRFIIDKSDQDIIRIIISWSDLLTFPYVSASPAECLNWPHNFYIGQVETHSFVICFPLVKQSQVNRQTNYFQRITSGLSCNTKESFKFALFFSLQSYNEKVFHNAPVSPEPFRLEY